MPVIIIASLLIAINLIMWIVFAARFKKIFTTEDIMNETREELNAMLREINNNADRNIELIDDRIKQLKAVSAKAERNLAVLRNELVKVEDSAVFQAKLDSLGMKDSAIKIPSQSQHSRKRTAQSFDSLQGNLFVNEKEELGARTTDQAAAHALSAITQMEAASSEVGAQNNLPTEKIRRIPIMVPDVYMAEKPVTPKKDFATQVRELHELGETDEAIAIKLKRSVQEVKFALEF